jgi:archaellum biogenesis protein FlaJ (TadC family)
MTTSVNGCPMEETMVAKKILQLVPKLSSYMKKTSMATTLVPHERLLSLLLKFAKEVEDEEFLTKPQITCLSEFGLFYTTSLENVSNASRNCLRH